MATVPTSVQSRNDEVVAADQIFNKIGEQWKFNMLDPGVHHINSKLVSLTSRTNAAHRPFLSNKNLDRTYDHCGLTKHTGCPSGHQRQRKDREDRGRSIRQPNRTSHPPIPGPVLTGITNELGSTTIRSMKDQRCYTRWTTDSTTYWASRSTSSMLD